MDGKVVFLFSGQGSQHFHMARQLYERVPEFRSRLDSLDVFAARTLGQSVRDRIYDPGRTRFDPFDRLLHSNPALFMVQYALADTLIGMGARPDLLMGGSLGELVALAVAGVLPAEEVLGLVMAIARVMEERGPRGGMLAVLGPPTLAADHPSWFADTEVAAIGSDRHFVVAGPAERLAALKETLVMAGHAGMVLPVCHAFHSSLMEPLRPLFSALFRGRAWAPPRIPVLSTLLATDLRQPDGEHCWRLLREPIQLRAAFRLLEARQDSLFVDIGPSGTMTTGAKYNMAAGSRSTVLSTLPLMADDWSAFQAVRTSLNL